MTDDHDWRGQDEIRLADDQTLAWKVAVGILIDLLLHACGCTPN